MSRLKHKRRADGGKVSWSGGNQNVIKEAHERKHGGAVKHHEEGEGEEPKHHAGRRSRGGGVKRARGGAVGADKRPLSSAAHTKKLPEEKGGGQGAGPANEQTDH